MKSFKSFYEEFTFKVDVEGLPDMFMKGNSPGSVKNHLRKLVKQPSMIKSVDRMTKHDVKKTYRAKSQGKEVDEMTQQSKELPNLKIAVGTSAQKAKAAAERSAKRKNNRKGTHLAAQYESKDKPPREYDYEGEMAKQQLRTISDAAKELHDMLSDDENMPEWVQNKITKAKDYIDTARDYLKSDVKEATDISELSPATVKSYKKKASDSNYKAASRFARVAASPTSRKYKNKEMGKQDDIMRKRKAGLAMADKKEGSSGDIDYGSDESIKIMKKKTPGQTENYAVHQYKNNKKTGVVKRFKDLKKATAHANKQDGDHRVHNEEKIRGDK